MDEQVIKALEVVIPDAKCPMCGTSLWQVEPGSFQHMRRQGSSVLPSIALVCQTCGNIQMIALEVLLKRAEGK
jgi:RNase P subunit RPR2